MSGIGTLLPYMKQEWKKGGKYMYIICEYGYVIVRLFVGFSALHAFVVCVAFNQESCFASSLYSFFFFCSFIFRLLLLMLLPLLLLLLLLYLLSTFHAFFSVRCMSCVYLFSAAFFAFRHFFCSFCTRFPCGFSSMCTYVQRFYLFRHCICFMVVCIGFALEC